jgi:hypothetical protein
MDRTKRLLVRSRIDKTCCEHYTTNKYYLGYLYGIKCCIVAICQDCERAQAVGGWFGNLISKIIGRLHTCKIHTHKIDIVGEVAVYVKQYPPPSLDKINSA